MHPSILSRVFGWAKTHGHWSIQFEERSSEICVMVWTWERSTFRRVCVAVLSRFKTNTTLEATILGENYGCCSSKCICCVSAWSSACSGRAFCKLSGKRVACETRGIPHFWSPAAEALPPANCCICVWEPGPVLNVRIRDKPFEVCRVSGLDGVSSRIAKGHYYERPLHARPRRCGCKHCWDMAINFVIPKRDWPQRWWR